MQILPLFTYHSTFDQDSFLSVIQFRSNLLQGSWQGHVTRRTADACVCIGRCMDQRLTTSSNHRWGLGTRVNQFQIIVKLRAWL